MSEMLDKLEPYINGEQPDERGETNMYCPLHDDTKRSASLNIGKGVWYCHAGCGGGSIRRLLDSEDHWVPMDDRQVAVLPSGNGSVSPAHPVERPTRRDVRRWHRNLMRSEDRLEKLYQLRGITPTTARSARLGSRDRKFTIPVFGPHRQLWNVRTYDPMPTDGRRKIWSVKGMGQPRLYPIRTLLKTRPGDSILICEGEWDCLLALQHGQTAVTRTGAAKVWDPEWSHLFTGLCVFICHDMDEMGQEANTVVRRELRSVADSVKVCRLPYQVTEKNGKDLTDYLLENYNEPAIALQRLMEGGRPR